MYALALLVAGAATGASGSLAIMPLHLEKLAVNDAARLEKKLADDAAAHGYAVQDEATTTKLVEASQNLGIDCDTDAVDCGTKLGAIANVQFLLVAHAAGGLDGMVGIDARLIDVQKGAQVRRATALLPSEPDEQMAAFDAFANALFSSASLASLHVDVDQTGASVEVDGVTNLDALVPGEHWLVVKKSGFLAFQKRVTAPSSVSVVLVVDPNAVKAVTAPASGVSVPLVAAGVGGGMVVIGGIAAIVGYLPLADFGTQEAKLNAIDARHDVTFKDSVVTAASTANGLAQKDANAWDGYGQALFFGGLGGLAVGAVVAGVAGAMALLTAAPEEPASTTTTAAAATSAVVAPAPPR
jgi:hypothetical protein